MKISSASKKVLASALSAAMVVAFAPTVAFGAQTATAKIIVEGHASSGKTISYESAYYDVNNGPKGLTTALAAAGTADFIPTVIGTSATGKDIEGFVKVEDGKIVVYDAAQKATGESYAFDASSVQVLADTEGEFTVPAGVTLDLNGNTLVNDSDGLRGANDQDNTKTTVTFGDGATVKNGTVKAVSVKDSASTDDSLATHNSALVADASGSTKALTVEDVTVEATSLAVDATSVTVKGTDTLGAIKAAVAVGNGKKAATAKTGAITGAATVAKGSTLEAVATNTKAEKSAVAISGAATVGENATLTATATNSGATEKAENATPADVKAVAIGGGLTASSDGAKVTATATNTGSAITAAKTSTATGIGGAAKVGKKASLTVSASATDGKATGIAGAVDLAGDVTVKASGLTDKTSVALGAGVASGKKITTGTFEGQLEGFTASTYVIEGGKFTSNPKAYVDTAKYAVTDDGTYYAVAQAKTFGVALTTAGSNILNGLATTGSGDAATVRVDNAKVVTDAVEAMMQELAAGKTPAGLKLADGVKAEDILAQAKSSTAPLMIGFSFSQYNEKKATDAQKADKAAIDAFAKDNLYKADGFSTVSLTLQYTNAAGNTVVMANVTDLGSTTDRVSVDNVITWITGSYGYLKIAAAADGKAATLDYVKDYNDVKPGAPSYDDSVAFRAIPSVVAYVSVDEEAIKDAINKGDKPATEKATQGIDVDKKSKTVKLAKKAAKTKKAASFNLGASAQTGLTIAKASGSAKITVAGNGKVTLKKGAKKGTYKAKVTINAAASDAYLAAAKTVTVTFKVAK